MPVRLLRRSGHHSTSAIDTCRSFFRSGDHERSSRRLERSRMVDISGNTLNQLKAYLDNFWELFQESLSLRKALEINKPVGG